MVSPLEDIITMYVGGFKKGFYYVKLVSEGVVQAEIKKLLIIY